MTLSDFLLAELRSLSVRPTMREWLDGSATWERVEVSESPTQALAAERTRHVDGGLVVAMVEALDADVRVVPRKRTVQRRRTQTA